MQGRRWKPDAPRDSTTVTGQAPQVRVPQAASALVGRWGSASLQGTPRRPA